MNSEESKNKYLDYVTQHIITVNKVWKKMEQPGVMPASITKIQIEQIHENIIIHDESKMGFWEFEAYRARFFTSESDEEISIVEKDFHKAWVHHIANNPHHWEHWVTFKNGSPYPCEIPFIYLIEMLCDWTAMSVKFNNRPTNWFIQNKDKMILHTQTASLIKGWLPLFDYIWLMMTDEIAATVVSDKTKQSDSVAWPVLGNDGKIKNLKFDVLHISEEKKSDAENRN